jgi:iron complex transport system ATP-binding protein
MIEKTGTAAILDNVTFFWPGAESPLFEEINLNFPNGSTACLIGPNGSGKTTMMELILGWRRATSGSIRLEGRTISSIPSRERGRMMALVPQEERLPFSYTVLEYVLLGRAPYLPPLAAPGKRDRKLALEALDRVGIAHLAHRAVPRLSGGEKRMVLISRALVQEPRILLLDEPANHLDPANRERVMDVLIKLRSSGITLIISSHEPDMVTRLADSVVFLHPGRMPLMGSTEEMIVPEKLSELYGIRAKIVVAEGRRIILWGK